MDQERQLSLTSKRADLASALARDVQHSFNNIINAAFGYTNLLLRRPDEDIAEHLMAALERASVLMGSYTYLARESAPNIRELAVAELLKELEALLAIFPDGHLVYEAPPEHLVLVDANKHELFLVLLKLALKSREVLDGDVHLSVSRSAPSWADISGPVITVSIGGDAGPQRTLEELGPADHAAVLASVATLGGRIRGDGAAHCQLVIPTGETVLNADVLLVVSEKAVLQHHRELLSGCHLQVADVADPADALEVFEKDPGAFRFVIFDGSESAIGSRALLMRVKAMSPATTVVVFTGPGTVGLPADIAVSPPESSDSWRTVLGI